MDSFNTFWAVFSLRARMGGVGIYGRESTEYNVCWNDNDRGCWFCGLVACEITFGG